MEAPLERALWTTGFFAAFFFFVLLARFGRAGCKVAPLLRWRGLRGVLGAVFLTPAAFFGEAFLGDAFLGDIVIVYMMGADVTVRFESCLGESRVVALCNSFA